MCGAREVRLAGDAHPSTPKACSLGLCGPGAHRSGMNVARKIWLLALNDVRLTVRDRAAFFWMLAMPLAMMWFFGGVGGGGGSGPPRVALDVVNHDSGWLGEALVEELDDESIVLRRIAPEEADTTEGKVRTLVIPEGFTDNVLAGNQQALRLEVTVQEIPLAPVLGALEHLLAAE